MLRRLRLKFVVINMTIVTAMLCVIFGLVYHSTRVDLEQENLAMMRAVASFPALDRPGRPDELPEEVRLPYFILQIGEDGARRPRRPALLSRHEVRDAARPHHTSWQL